jgi:Zn-finger nucleic acid-binding protein
VDCPVCKNAMITLELSEVEIDYCTGCDGIWLDAGELERLLENSGRAESFIHSFKVQHHATETKRKCPICRKKMEKVIVGTSEPPLMIDKCTKGHGLWFDKGELQNILDKAELDKEGKIRKLLADMFGMAHKK